MQSSSATTPPRYAVVDLGSNSVRLVVFEGLDRNPTTIFNEKAVLRLGRGLQDTGRLNAEGVAQTVDVMGRYAAIARAMRAAPFEVLATAAVRDAANGAEFVADLKARMPGVPIRILSGEQEAGFSADGLLCGMPDADGLLADIGGGSLELVRIERGARGAGVSLKLGVIRLADRAGGDLERARVVAEGDLDAAPGLSEIAGRGLYLVGGAWRGLARVQMARSGYALNMIQSYTLTPQAARELAILIAGSPRRVLERMSGMPRRRVDDLPYAAIVLRRLLRSTGAGRVVFSALGLREGWYMQLLSAATRAEDPLLAAGHALSRRLGRDQGMPPALLGWTARLFPDETPQSSRLREAACWMSDAGSHDHPEYRAEQSFLRVLRQPGSGVDHPARAFLATVLALRYDTEPEAAFLAPARALMVPEAWRTATVLGMGLRLAYTLSAGTPDLLAGTELRLGRSLTLRLTEGTGVFAGESVTRRLDRLGQALGVPAMMEAAE